MANRSELKLLSLLRINHIFIELSPKMNLSQLSAFLVAALHQPNGEGESPPTIRELATTVRASLYLDVAPDRHSYATRRLTRCVETAVGLLCENPARWSIP